MKVILPTQSKQKYLLDLLKTNKTLGDTSFVSLSVFLNGLVEVNRDALLVRIYKALNTLKEDPSVLILKEILGYPMIAESFLNFITKMAEEGWTLEDLPLRSDKEKALHYILSKLLGESFEVFNQWKAFESLDLRDVEVLENAYSFAQNKRLTKAKERGLRIISIAEKKSLRKLYFANTPRSEAQAAVQEILQSSIAYEDTSIVCLDPGLMSQVESFLKQYEVPYQKVGHGNPHPIFRFFRDTLHFVVEPNLSHFVDLVHNDVYDFSYKQSLLTYCEAFKPDLMDLMQPLNHVSTAFNEPKLDELLSKKAYLDLESEAETALNDHREELIALMSAKPHSIVETLSHVFNFVVSVVSETDENVSALYALKELIEGAHYDALDGVSSWLELVDHQVLNLTLSAKTKSGVILTDLSHGLIPGIKKQIWLSCTQAFYPQVKTNSGLFDEDYVLGIKGYDVKERYDFHMANLEKLQKSSDELIYSYAIGSYEGKAQRLAYELEKELEGIEATRWALVETNPLQEKKVVQLKPELAQALYFEKGLEGSVSSFETYFRCPYQYFLKRGLKLREDEELNLNRLSLGNLLHALLESAVKLKGAQYASYLYENLTELTKPYIAALERLFPSEKESLRLVELKSLAILKLSLIFLMDKENATEFKASVVEKPFDLAFPLSSGHAIHFKGIIDRIDLRNKDAVIIDYKSSMTTFTESQFNAGIKLQLPTYAWALQAEGLKPKAALYFGLSPEKIELSADPSFDVKAEVLKSRRLKGMIFSKDEGIDTEGSHIVGFGLSSKGLKYPTPYNLEALVHELQVLYDEMERGLKSGNILKQNKDKSCLYCPYKGFCQYKGPVIKIAHVSTKDSKVLDK